MERYPHFETYRTLYERFFSPVRLNKLLEGLVFADKKVLDLCCGEGRIAIKAESEGARKVIAIDREMDMLSYLVYHPKAASTSGIPGTIEIICDDIEMVLLTARLKKIDIVVCQQGANYWLTLETAIQLHKIMEDGGIFVFNTFNRLPSETPQIKNYKLNGLQYWECSYLSPLEGNIIHHVQVCEGIPPHVTSFPWLSQGYIMNMLRDLFSVSVEIEGPSSTYRCVKLST